MEKRRYPAKILLFGEYTVLLGSEALAIPWTGQYAFWQQTDITKSMVWSDLYFYLKDQNFEYINLDAFYESIQAGWYLESNIIQGYGVGSSGAVIAAIYDKFKTKKDINPEQLRSIFANMEAFYHGHSSGFDPLIAYSQQAIHVQRSGSMQYLNTAIDLSNFYLLDSDSIRSRSQTVSATFRRLESEPSLGQRLVTLQNDAIQAIVNQNSSLPNHFKNISSVQIERFPELIPRHLQAWWKEGLNTNHFYCKLCGAGGGGYYLLFALESENLEHLKRDYKLIALSNYSSVRY